MPFSHPGIQRILVRELGKKGSRQAVAGLEKVKRKGGEMGATVSVSEWRVEGVSASDVVALLGIKYCTGQSVVPPRLTTLSSCSRTELEGRLFHPKCCWSWLVSRRSHREAQFLDQRLSHMGEGRGGGGYVSLGVGGCEERKIDVGGKEGEKLRWREVREIELGGWEDEKSRWV
ncbi:hypothetical protein Pcinc_026228 [Petrolisthes cinctipes]|uniref:Uncharacterized protein n=1 Tax=Petrolisthes cinctipes TaxID=88211 RepID=A0AAE1F7Q6_PETCI|nr:hypothetical protein Pcinc_026228 [Petrolisthes cinctipes]